ncbi:hypothetical protein MUK42_32606 [Musa troglodytarum]|uniref:Uncharacterized protein n=1 Tax=Musa troglodytarum TaxID=320322 RepID=A0A9E7FUJ1_9LILI|nr:hypothetical protein MUK42_32606 [Musa troglodytarum]
MVGRKRRKKLQQDSLLLEDCTIELPLHQVNEDDTEEEGPSFLFSDQENAVKASILRIMGRLQKSCFLTENLNEEDIRSVGAMEWSCVSLVRPLVVPPKSSPVAVSPLRRCLWHFDHGGEDFATDPEGGNSWLNPTVQPKVMEKSDVLEEYYEC